MPRVRTSATELARLLDQAGQPVYLLNDEQRLVFCNRACLEWVGRAAEDLVGQTCAYHSSPEVEPGGAAGLAAGLCPPPEAWSIAESRGIVTGGPDGQRTPRRARFVRLLGEADEPAGMAVFVEPTGENDPDFAPLDEPAALHHRLRTLQTEMRRWRSPERLLGDSPPMRRARAQAELAATSAASVAIAGPPGSGRQHVASLIHYASGPNPGALVPLSCAVLGAELIDSTVAALAHAPADPGAGRGTLLLNDVDQLPADVQKDLVGLLGGRTFPLRAMATARRSLVELARAGDFRADLAAALSTIEIVLPPLAERRGDLPLLAQFFLEEVNARGGKQIGGFSPEAMDALDAHPWARNLDELSSAVREAHAHAESTQIGIADLPQHLRLAAAAAAHPRRVETTIVLDQFLAEVEVELIRRAVARVKGNKAKAARLLGISRPRLYRRMEQLGLLENS